MDKGILEHARSNCCLTSTPLESVHILAPYIHKHGALLSSGRKVTDGLLFFYAK